MTTITATLGDLVQAEPALTSVCALRLTPKAAYHLKKLANLVAVETKHFHTERHAYIRDLGEKKGDQFTIGPECAGWVEFVAKVNALSVVPVEIAWGPVSLAMFGDEKVSAADLIALGPLFADLAEEAAV